jgi:hypothetical protein
MAHEDRAKSGEWIPVGIWILGHLWRNAGFLGSIARKPFTALLVFFLLLPDFVKKVTAAQARTRYSDQGSLSPFRGSVSFPGSPLLAMYHHAMMQQL